MSEGFRLLMIGAMYENGGNTTHRHLDGHPQLFVYPFESQIGTRLVNDRLSSMFPLKYRWPTFDLDGTAARDFDAIIDEECKVRARTPQVSKFRHVAFDFSDEERKRFYVDRIAKTGRARAKNVAAFFEATFDAWKDYRRTGREFVHVGYSPIITVDAAAILTDLAGAVVLHVVRNPWSAFADTKKRPVPMSLEDYMLAWTTTQRHALLMKELFPGRGHVVRIEDVMADPVAALKDVCRTLGIESDDSLRSPSWNGAPLTEVYPWGTIRKATNAVNRETALELSMKEREAIRAHAGPYLEAFDYKDFL